MKKIWSAPVMKKMEIFTGTIASTAEIGYFSS